MEMFFEYFGIRVVEKEDGTDNNIVTCQQP